MNTNRNYYQMQLEGHPLAPPEVEVSEREVNRFRELVRRGQGSREFDDDCKYEGEFQNGELHGKGVYYFNDKSVYEGSFLDGWFHGQGTYKVPEGKHGAHIFKGEYREGKREGPGQITYANGIIYEGEVKASELRGKGRLKFPNGDVYVGEFENDMPHGEGKYEFVNNSVYEGQFFKGKMHGKGRFIFPEKAVYDHEEYLPTGLNVPDKLRIPAGQVEGEFVQGEFFKAPILPSRAAVQTPADLGATTGGTSQGGVGGGDDLDATTASVPVSVPDDGPPPGSADP